MSGILGVWNFDGAPVERSLLQRLAASIEHRGRDATGFWLDGPVGFAACLDRVTPESTNEVQPAVAPGDAVCVFDGRLDNRDEILAATRDSSAISAASPDCALVLAAYSCFGEKFAERLLGDFACAVFDFRLRRLLLARDFMGLRPLYYARRGETFLFASEIKTFLAYPDFPRVPNEDALAVFLAQGISQGQRGQTLFSGVYKSPPAHVLTITSQKILRSRYWSFDSIPARVAKSADDHLQEFRWHFERAVARRIRSAYPVAVSVSGGLDSSSVFCVAETLRRNSPSSFPPILGVTATYPSASPADERAYVAEIERQYGVAIANIPAESSSDPVSVFRRGIWHADIPILDAQWDSSHEYYKAIAGLGPRVLLTGHWGDLVAGESSHLVDLFNQFRFSEVWTRLREFPAWTTDFLPGHHTRQFLQDLLRYQKNWLPQTVIRVLRRLRARHHLPALYSDSLQRRARAAEWRKRQPRSSLPSFHARSLSTILQAPYFLTATEENNKVLAMHGMEIAYPFVDRDVLCCVLSVPPEVYSAGAAPRGIVRQALRGVLPVRIAGRRDKADFTYYVNATAGLQFAGIASALQGDSRILRRALVKPDSLARDLQRWNDEIHSHGPTYIAATGLQRLYQLELWLQIFFDESENYSLEVTSCAGQSVMRTE